MKIMSGDSRSSMLSAESLPSAVRTSNPRAPKNAVWAARNAGSSSINKASFFGRSLCHAPYLAGLADGQLYESCTATGVDSNHMEP